MSAKEIWKHDSDRVELLKSIGYNVIVVWESDLKLNLWKSKFDHLSLDFSREVSFDEKKDTLYERSSVGKSSLADVKPGELLETSHEFSSHNVSGNGDRDGSRMENEEQSAAKLLYGNVGEGSEATVSLNAT